MTRIIINTYLKVNQNRTFFLTIKDEEITNPDVEIELEDASVFLLKK